MQVLWQQKLRKACPQPVWKLTCQCCYGAHQLSLPLVPQVAARSPPRVSARSSGFTTTSRGQSGLISPRSGIGSPLSVRSPAGLSRSPAVRLPTMSRTSPAEALAPAPSSGSGGGYAEAAGAGGHTAQLQRSCSAAPDGSGRTAARRQPVVSAFSLASVTAAAPSHAGAREPTSAAGSAASTPARQPARCDFLHCPYRTVQNMPICPELQSKTAH